MVSERLHILVDETRLQSAILHFPNLEADSSTASTARRLRGPSRDATARSASGVTARLGRPSRQTTGAARARRDATRTLIHDDRNVRSGM